MQRLKLKESELESTEDGKFRDEILVLAPLLKNKENFMDLGFHTCKEVRYTA